MDKHNFAVLIGRFQPFHNGHLYLLQEALKVAEKVIVVIGSADNTPDPKNPWSAFQRRNMITLSLTQEEIDNVIFIHMPDVYNDDKSWESILKYKISLITKDQKVILVGHKHDVSSYYLDMFPSFDKHLLPNNEEFLHATKIRDLYFTSNEDYKKHVPKQVASYLEEFYNNENYENLLAYYNALQKKRDSNTIYQTADILLVKSNHVLVIRRGKDYGKGQLALPGGHVEVNETIKNAALRELLEETDVSLSYLHDFTSFACFDKPNRSLRGRVISSVYYYKLSNIADFPPVKAGSDASEAFWMPIDELSARRKEFFEDHYHIITHFLMGK